MYQLLQDKISAKIDYLVVLNYSSKAVLLVDALADFVAPGLVPRAIWSFVKAFRALRSTRVA